MEEYSNRLYWSVLCIFRIFSMYTNDIYQFYNSRMNCVYQQLFAIVIQFSFDKKIGSNKRQIQNLMAYIIYAQFYIYTFIQKH